MTVRLGDTAPDFTADTTQGEINFHDWLGDSWGVLFSHPKDFTPVCTTELGYVAKIKPEFDKRNVKVIGLSVDPVDSHVKWEADIAETQGTAVNFPMIGDPDRKVADLYDMIHPNASDTMTVRSVFIIGPDKKVKLTLTYPASTGRNFDEILRVIDSLQLTAKYKVATPANWTDGDDVIIGGAVTNEEAEKLFPQGWTTVKPYLRVLAPAEQVASPPVASAALVAGTAQLLAQHEAQAAPRVVDRADLVVDPAGRQQVVAERVLGDVGGHAAALLRPGDPHPAIRCSRLRQLRPCRVQLRARVVKNATTTSSGASNDFCQTASP